MFQHGPKSSSFFGDLVAVGRNEHICLRADPPSNASLYDHLPVVAILKCQRRGQPFSQTVGQTASGLPLLRVTPPRDSFQSSQ
jgi:hypothetical protein